MNIVFLDRDTLGPHTRLRAPGFPHRLASHGHTAAHEVAERIADALDPDTLLPAVGQGAIGIERRLVDSRAAAMLEAIHHGPTGQRLKAERAFLAALDGSCQTPIAGLAELSGGNLRLRGEILRVDGSEVIRDDQTAAIEDGAALGREMARKMLEKAGPGFF